MKTITPSKKLKLIESAKNLLYYGLISHKEYDKIIKEIYNSINIDHES